MFEDFCGYDHVERLRLVLRIRQGSVKRVDPTPPRILDRRRRDFNAADPRTYPDRFSIRAPGESDYYVKGKEVGLFAQDKWKVNRRMTLSLGLRYDLEVVPID